jgi:outer membrane lipoprotein
MKTIVLLFGSIILLQGCVYPISKNLVEKTDKTITFEMLQADPDMYKGKIVILGGSIAKITSMAEGALIEVNQAPLDYWGKPLRINENRGRFLVYTPMYIDPGIYALDRVITVAGEIKGTTLILPENKELTKYSYPVLVSKELKLWPNKQEPDEPGWWDPLWNPLPPTLPPVR